MIHSIRHLPEVIRIGVQTESGVEAIGFDLRPWLDMYDGIDVTIWPTRPGESAAYRVADKNMELVGTVLYWYPDLPDTSIAGCGTVELLGITGDKRKLSGVCKTEILPTSLGETQEAPEAARPWVDEVLDAAEEAKKQADRAEQIADSLVGAEAPGVVRYDQKQALTEAEKALARQNIGAGTGGEVTTDKTLTQENAAADAKAVGDKFTALSEEIARLPQGGGGLPEGGEPYQQLVTDADGNTVWEEREFYSEIVSYYPRKDIFSGTYTSVPIEELGGAFAGVVDSVTKDDVATNKAYNVEFNGTTYTNQIANMAVHPGFYCFGNFSLANSMFGTSYPDTGEPYVIAIANAYTLIISDFTQSTTDAVTMYLPEEIVENVKKLPNKYIPVGGIGEGENAEVFNDTLNNRAIGRYSHAEGSCTTASSVCDHAEGVGTTASGTCSHAEGKDTTARGACSHAEGVRTIASGGRSHAEGSWTISAGEAQHVQGKYNIEDVNGKYAHIVGNGYDDGDRSNAHTLDWDGNAWYQGTVESAGILLTSPNGTKYKVTVADDGTLTATAAE